MSESREPHNTKSNETADVSSSASAKWLTFIFAGIVIAYAMLCLFYDRGAGTAVKFSDTLAFELSASRASISELNFYITSRPFATLFLYKAFPDRPHVIVGVQVFFSLVSWLLLAFAIGQLFRSTWARVTSITLILFFSLAWPIQSWNYVLLSESLSFSLMAFVFGLTILMLCYPTKYLRVWSIVVWFFFVVMWCGTRDTVTYSLITFGLVVVALLWVYISRYKFDGAIWRQPVVLKLLLIGACLGVTVVFTNWLSEQSGRWKTPVLNTLLLRIMPDPSAYNEWVTVLGMPDSPRLRGFVGKYSWDRADGEYEVRELLLGIRKEGDKLNGFQEWYAFSGLNAMRRYLMRHSCWTIGTAAKAYVNFIPNRAGEYHVDVPKPLVSRIMAWVFYPEIGGGVSLAAFTVVLLTSSILCACRHLWPLLVVSLMLTLNSFIQFTVAFHGDFAEPNRHTFLASIFIRLALLISAVALIEFFATCRRINDSLSK